MLLCLQGYDYIFHYYPGKEMALPDTLSCFKPKPGPEITLDIAICHALTDIIISGHIKPGSHQVSQTCASACHNHSMNTTISCTCDPRTKPCCPSFYTYSHAKGHPTAYNHLYTKCNTYATMTVRPCPHCTKMSDHRDVTEEMIAPGSSNDALDPECP